MQVEGVCGRRYSSQRAPSGLNGRDNTMGSDEVSIRRSLDERFALLLVVNDLVVCAASIVIVYQVQVSVSFGYAAAQAETDIGHYLAAVPTVLGLWVITFYASGLYRLRQFVSSLSEMTASLRAVTIVTVLGGVAGLIAGRDYPAVALPLFWGVAVPLTLASRGLLRVYARKIRASGPASPHTLIIGCGKAAKRLLQRLESYRLLDYEILGFVSVLEHREMVDGRPVLGSIDDLAELIKQHGVDEVVVAQPEISSEQLMRAVETCWHLGVGFQIVASPLQLLMKRTRMSALADLPVLELPHPQSPAWQRAIKRGADIVLSCVLVVLSAPLMLPIMLLVWRETKGSAIFRQDRIGYQGRPFTIYKFRTMYVSAEPYAAAPETRQDARIGRIGGWLRRTSLDELPQLVNVIKGDMSLVGPRPEMRQFVEKYEPWQRRRLDVKPGLTGLWQILGRKDIPLRENIEYDLYYMLNWSIWLDFVIILKTIPVAISGRGAY